MPEWKIPLYKIYTDDEDLNLVTKIIKLIFIFSIKIFRWMMWMPIMTPHDYLMFFNPTMHTTPTNSKIAKWC